jgi:hypothetical protein
VIFEEEPRGGFFDPALAGYSGLELMRLFLGAFREGKGAPPPIYHLTGLVPTEAGPGMSTFRMPASGWLATSARVFLERPSVSLPMARWERRSKRRSHQPPPIRPRN